MAASQVFSEETISKLRNKLCRTFRCLIDKRWFLFASVPHSFLFWAYQHDVKNYGWKQSIYPQREHSNPVKRNWFLNGRFCLLSSNFHVQLHLPLALQHFRALLPFSRYQFPGKRTTGISPCKTSFFCDSNERKVWRKDPREMISSVLSMSSPVRKTDSCSKSNVC